tara:strand:+ start:147 stop:971 length:825 start_codon:yes stop_codon:yes gene_type:complete
MKGRTMDNIVQTELESNAHLFFPVQEMPIYNQQGELIKDYKQLRNGNSNQLLSIQKKTYQLLSNEECLVKTVAYLDKHFDTEGMIVNPVSAPDGSVIRYDFTLPAHNKPFKDSKLILKASMFNSYNGTKSFVLRISFVYEICTNGMTSQLWDIYIQRRHNTKKELILEHTTTPISINEVGDHLDRWSRDSISQELIQNQSMNLCHQPSQRDRSHVNQAMYKYILEQYATYAKRYGANKFSAYQAFTHWSTHYPSASINTVYDRQRKVANNSWFH